jgi:hypothetical protein
MASSFTARARRGPVLGLMALALPGLFALGGCLSVKTVTAPVKLAAVTVITVSETTGAAVVGTGRVAQAALTTSSQLTAGGIEALGQLSVAGMVTLLDADTGTLLRLPWQEGLTVALAGELARVEYARRALAVVRGGRLVHEVKRVRGATTRFPLRPGDVVRLVSP